MKKAQSKVIEELRQEGYAVCIFTPEELGKADPGHVEDIMCERGTNAIEDLK